MPSSRSASSFQLLLGERVPSRDATLCRRLLRPVGQSRGSTAFKAVDRRDAGQ
ncbi:hypothetical protein [Streptomyces murinus]|uniref:hypothetical protein n=1 Tax=Streptomyces murinus TaxID=33900 RepID=UPI002E1531EF|nr:hypothetical protein OG516_37390 [Streptomyces murinus]